MHELGQLIQELMDSERMTQADLARRSGLSPQVVSSLIKHEMKALPARATFDGLRQAFPAVPYSTFVLRAAASMGIPVEDQPTADYNGLSNDALLGILKDRLEGDSDGRQPEAQKTPNPDDDGGSNVIRFDPGTTDPALPVEQAAYTDTPLTPDEDEHP